MKFSQRIGKTPVKNLLQVDGIDEALKNRLWDCIVYLIANVNRKFMYETIRFDNFLILIWTEFFVRTSDSIPYNSSYQRYDGFLNKLREWFFTANWYEIYDIIEFLCSFNHINDLRERFVNHCNIALSKEVSGYRIANNKIAQITSEEEISEIEEAINDSGLWKPVTLHLSTSLNLLSDRNNPDYRNSVKESISAVESMCKIVIGDSSATLGRALAEIEKLYPLHKALKAGFSSIYGYTSDASGIRHALLEDDIEVKFEDAKFMLVSCSAFINYLKMKVRVD
ncbi:hypothetical protein HNQ93_001487 [Hymenobacter luteus]|uniref:HEPN AbiJ-N-terminal domain-containing protein n=2 Tax=Hymenobacter TaxID=89966 RepID=A0A7W9WBS3_9BACT|nr:MULTISPECIES: hypothetical protein [Hymenobacter]MBB4601152.1 hypothetical protein [Hymenobacter latericoloratus]MBB6058641.1 hypothetical protein [Hymenobacter luteus]